MDEAPPVLELIQARLRADPGSRGDPYRLGLAIEGGGMRGVVSAAAMIALQDVGILRTFDAVYGTSAGSINAAYILAGQPWTGLSIYYDHLATGGFIDRQRALRGQPIVSMSTVKRILDVEVPLKRKDVIAASPPLYVGVSNLSTCSGELRSAFASPDDLDAALLEGSHLPVLAGRPVQRGGNLYVDGGVFFPHAIYAAAAGECSHILALTTRVQGPPRRKLSAWQRKLSRILNRWARGAGDKYLAEIQRYIVDRRTMGYGETHVAGRRLYRLAASPGGHTVKRLTKDRLALLEAARCGYSGAAVLFGDPNRDPSWVFSIRRGEDP